MQVKYHWAIQCLLLSSLAAAQSSNINSPQGNAKPVPSQATEVGIPVVAAWVDGHPIYLSDVDASLGREGYLLQKQLYDLRLQGLKNLIQKYLLMKEATERNLSEAALTEEIMATAAPVTSLDITAEWANHQSSLRPMGEIAAKYEIAATISTRRKLEALDKHLQELNHNHNVRVEIPAPHLPLISDTTSIILGSADAPLTLTIFLDYECPFCKRLDEQLEQLLAQEPFHSNLRIAIKHFPLPTHPTAASAAEAAVCAARQGKLGLMHVRLFQVQPTRHTEADLVRAAEQANLDIENFRSCMASRWVQNEVSKDVSEAGVYGVDATPTLFLNGQLLPSADFSALRSQLETAINGLGSRASIREGTSGSR